MNYLKQTQRIHRDDSVLNQTSSPLLTGAIIAALLAGGLAGLFGAIPVLFGLFLLVFMAFSFNNYRIGIWIAVFLLPLIATKYIPREFFGIKGLNPLNANLLMSIASLAFVQAFQYKKLIIPAWPRHFWLYIGTMVIAGFYGATHFSSIPSHYLVFFDTPAGYLRDYLLKPMIIVITAFLLSVSIANARRPSNYLIPLFCSAIILPIVVIVYIAVSGVPLSTLASSQSRGFLSVIGMHANEQGFMFNMVFAMALFCFFSISGTWKKWIYGGMVTILIIAIMLTFSRGAYLGFLSVVAYFLFIQKRLRMTVVVLSLAIVAAILMPSAVIERATMGISGQQQSEDVSAGRVDKIWKPLLPEIISSPIIGHGLNSIIWSKAAQRDEILRVEHPHSAYLGVMLDFGLLGAIAIFIFFRHMWQLFKRLSISHPEPIWRGFFSGARAGVLLLLVQGLTDDRFTPTLPQAFLWFAYGMAIGLGARLNKETPGKTESTGNNARSFPA